jgi:hypothetical protein
MPAGSGKMFCVFWLAASSSGPLPGLADVFDGLERRMLIARIIYYSPRSNGFCRGVIELQVVMLLSSRAMSLPVKDREECDHERAAACNSAHGRYERRKYRV